ncbi:uncharacterized protein LOC113153922 isoform X2 [Anabas testudineus]|uniref:uncharacterized protein LOC113153922 isoform X2 n=1 Tax=Anabas testudineus TaxID=64144 RepID=UPI000E464479|nr:uncharacterized protein LOC113153922 isoform X2 [Anabas testudineus]
MDFNRSSCWSSVLEQAKAHIPTIDFNSSTSEDADFITVFQRPAGLSLQTLEDSDSFSMEEADLEVELDACQSSIVELSRAEPDLSAKPESYKDLTVLSFARLDQWDLDNVLQNLKHVTIEPVKTHPSGDKDRSQTDIMERLAAFCKNQSSRSVSESVKSANYIRQNNNWNNTLENMVAELNQSHQERPTVFLDLRCPGPSEKPPQISPSLSSESQPPAKHNIHQQVSSAKKPNLDVHSGSQVDSKEVTGKSILLQKIRTNKRNGNTYPNTRTNPPSSGPRNEVGELKHEPSRPTRGNPSTVQLIPAQEPKQQSGQQRQQPEQTLQHVEHLQILKQLETHRPTKSVCQKQTAAEGTDVLYDFEASHLQPFSVSPEDITSKDCILLTVTLSSPGMVGHQAHGKRKHLYPADAKSHIYNTLVAWFLSLVGPDPHNNEGENVAKVPFWVAGLQQMWTENGLALHVLAVARQCYTQRKRNVDTHAPFYNHVCKFLSETSLAQIAHWLPELKILLAQQAFASPIHLPSSSLKSFISATFNKKAVDRTFGLSSGFYWQTVETQECVWKGRETTQELHTEVSLALGCSDFFLHPLITHYTLQLVFDSGLDVCGLWLLYPPQRFLTDSAGVIQSVDETCQPVFALAVRGPHAFSVLKDLTGSLCPLLPKKIAPTSVSALYRESQEPSLFNSPQLASEVHKKLCLWFSGRLVQNPNEHLKRVVPSSDGVRDSLFNLSSSSAFLCATTKADVLLVVSPAVPPCCYGQVLAVCERRGFGLMGLQRLQLQSNGAALLRLTNQQTRVFCSSPSATLNQEELESPSLMREFKAQKLLDRIHSRRVGVHAVEPSLCFHTVPYSNNLFDTFVKFMWTVPDPSGAILSHQKCQSNCDMEQVVILTLCGNNMNHGLSLLHRMLTERPEGDVEHEAFKLLGLKWLPVLTQLQAQELSPYEVGEQLFHSSLAVLTSSPVLLCALRRRDAFASLRKFLPHDYPGNLSVLMSSTPEVTFRQASLFFNHEMIYDPQMLLTVCLFKPGTWNHALDKIFHKLQQSGLMLVGMRIVTLDQTVATSLLPAESCPSDLEAHVEYLCSGSSLALCLQGNKAVTRLLDMLRQKDSSLWAHCYRSGSYQKAAEDVRRLFPDGLCCPASSTLDQQQVFSMCSDSLASVERQQFCTLAPVVQERLTPLVPSEQNGGSLIRSALWQTTCLLIPLNAPPLSQVPSQLEMLEKLLKSGCHLVAGRMSILNNEQRKHIADILEVSSVGSERMIHLCTAPCLILALQGEKIVTDFTFILKSIYKERSDLEKLGNIIIYPESTKEAKQLICYLFDALSPDSCHVIVP